MGFAWRTGISAYHIRRFNGHFQNSFMGTSGLAGLQVLIDTVEGVYRNLREIWRRISHGTGARIC